MAIVKLGDIAMEAKSSNKGDKTGIKIVGLEHLTPSNVTLTSWSDDTNNSFTKEFSKHDVLFGRRRAYLKKAAVAPFDGICSGDITVIRAIEDKVNPNLLPFIIQNDFFFDFAVGKSAGSLSPRVKWTHLKEFTIELPPMPEQSKLAETLWSINETKNAYEDLINKIDELVKSQFIEMIESDLSIPKVCLGDIFEISSGGTPSRKKEEYWDDGKIPWVKISDMKSMYVTKTEECITELGLAKSSAKLYETGTFLISIFATLGEVSILDIDATTNQAIAGLVPKREIDTEYMYIALTQLKDRILDIGRGAAQNNINLSILKNLEISMPTELIRRKFSIFVEQSDKSKFALQEAIKDLDALSKKIIAENLIPAGKE